MEHLPEFIINHPFLWGALAVVLAMLVKAEYEHQTSRANQVSPTNAIRLLNKHDDALVLDVREATDYGKGHIRNARNIPLSSLSGKLEEISKYREAPVMAYCNSGAVSGKACRILQKAGFSNVHNLAGGLHGWEEAKLPLTRKK